MIGILGSGFGLYGYLPAVCQFHQDEVILLSKAKSIVKMRPELVGYYNRVIWVDDIKELISRARTLIVAYPSDSVFSLLDHILASRTLERLIVEKPVCSDPDLSLLFIDRVESRGLKIISGFLFIYTDWFKRLMSSDRKNIAINWNFAKSVNLVNNSSWKYSKDKGGGALKMYGVHLLAVLSFFGASLDLLHKNDGNFFIARFIGSKNIVFSVRVDLSEAVNVFEIENVVSLDTPFGDVGKPGVEDNRVRFIILLLSDFDRNYKFLNALLKDTMRLWQEIERPF